MDTISIIIIVIVCIALLCLVLFGIWYVTRYYCKASPPPPPIKMVESGLFPPDQFNLNYNVPPDNSSGVEDRQDVTPLISNASSNISSIDHEESIPWDQTELYKEFIAAKNRNFQMSQSPAFKIDM